MNALKGRKKRPHDSRDASPTHSKSPDGAPVSGAVLAKRGSEMDMAFGDDDDDCPPLQVLHKQLECLCMGVIGLSSLVLLKDPTIGISRQKRLAQEQDLLGHLKSVRHWITHRQAPGGWDPKGLASVALKCSNKDPPTLQYPRDETGGVLPQLKPMHGETPRYQAAEGDGKGHNSSIQSTHMTSMDSCQTSTTWPESSKHASRTLPIKSSREQAYAPRVMTGSPPPPPGNVAARQQWGKRNANKPKKQDKPEPEDFSGLFLDSTASQGPSPGEQHVSQQSTAEGFADMVLASMTPASPDMNSP